MSCAQSCQQERNSATRCLHCSALNFSSFSHRWWSTDDLVIFRPAALRFWAGAARGSMCHRLRLQKSAPISADYSGIVLGKTTRRATFIRLRVPLFHAGGAC
mmetsp:Transcript_9318/g.23528  ORF Transcript_9318/g.23528 Transcript_9318/m.23528 type:complete len:102 (-) Transcript_9318:123-428(-)